MGPVLAAAVTMILSTITGRFENAFYDRVVNRLFQGRTGYIDEHSSVDPDLAGHVVIVGYGRQGRRIVEELETLDRPYVVENDPARRDKLQLECQNYVFGDGMAEYPMEIARCSASSLVISTVDRRPVSEAILGLETDADLILRVDTSPEARELLDAGATFVTVSSVLASDHLLENVQRVLEDETAAADLQEEHRTFLREITLSNLTDE